MHKKIKGNLALIAVLFFLTTSNLSAQTTYTLTVQANHFVNSKFELSLVYKGDLKLIDTLRTDKQGKVQWVFPAASVPGIYKLKLMQELEREFMFIFNKENITMILPSLDEREKVKFQQSAENDLLLKYNNLQQEFNSITDIAFSFPLQDPFHKVILSEYKARHTKLNTFISDLKKTKPKMFITRLAAFEWRSGKYPEPGVNLDVRKKFLSDHYFAGLDFSDTTILYMPALTDMIVNYFSLQIGPADSRQAVQTIYKNVTDTLLTKTKPYPHVYNFMLDFLIDGMEQIGFEDIIAHVYEHYVAEGTCDDFNTPVVERARKRASQRKLLIKGADMPNIAVPDSNGKVVSLKEVKADNILLIFWSSKCEHCTLEIPEIYKWYEQYNTAKGYVAGSGSAKPLEIIAVSLDTDPQPWKDFVNQHQLNWINVCDFKRWDSPAALSYFIFGTPTMIVLDKNKKFVSIPSDINYLKIEFEGN